MTIDLSWAVGQVIEAVTFNDATEAWWFAFRGHGGLSLGCPWQILVADRLTRASGDHGQQYGLPAPIDAAAEATAFLRGRTIQSVEVDPAAGHLTMTLENATVLRTFSDSFYEVWHLVGPGNEEVVGQGGKVIPLIDTGSQPLEPDP